MPQEAKQKPAAGMQRDIWASTWKGVPRDCDLMTPMIFLEGSFVPGRPSALPNAETIAAQTRALPAGRAAIQWWRYSNSLFAPSLEVSPANVPLGTAQAHHPWDVAAATAVAAEWSGRLRDYRRAGGRLDLLVGDCERWGIFMNWSLDAPTIKRITSDPRMQQRVFDVQPLASMVIGVEPSNLLRAYHTDDYLQWNQAIGTLTAAAMRQAVWSPAVTAFPELRGSNFAGMRMLHNPAPDLHGHPQGADNLVGTASAPVCYGAIGCASTAWYIDAADPTKLAKSGSVRIDRTAWFSFLLDHQMARACRRTAPTVPLQPWIAQQLWPGGEPDQVGYPKDARYHDELVRHLALQGAEVILYWNPEGALPDSATVATPWTAAQRDASARRLNGVLREINAQTLGVVASTVTREAVPFDAAVVTSGALRRDGRWIWRTTVRDDVIGLKRAQDGSPVPLEADGRGRWDVTDSPIAPSYSVVTRSAPMRRGVAAESR